MGWILLLVCLPMSTLCAHAPNTSYLRCSVEPRRLELTFSFDMATLFRVIGYGINAKGSVSARDMEAASPEVYRFLEDTIQLQINGRPVSLGERQPMAWPVDGGSAIEEKDYQQKLIHFRYLRDSQSLIEDITLTYNVFDDLGGDHRVVADIQQSGKHLEVIFTQPEPDYLFDTYWRNGPPVVPESVQRFQSSVLSVWRYSACFLILVPFLLLRLGRWWAMMGILLLGLAAATGVVIMAEPGAGLGAWLGVGILVLAGAPPVVLFHQCRNKRHTEKFKSLPVSAKSV